jgi:RimJ/RimL family protein N-acetyltransferase
LPTIDLGVAGWCLRAWHGYDAPALAKHATNPNVWRWMSDGFPHPYTLEIAEHWVGRGHVEFGGDNWAIACNDEAVGGCGIHQGASPFHCTAEIGWWLAEEHWGLGIATRAARVLVARAFDNPAITRVIAPIHAGNVRSMGVAEKAGLTLEAVQRKSAFKAGKIIDRHLYAIVRED